MADPTPTIEIHRAHGSWAGAVETIDIADEGSVTLTICQTCHYIDAVCDHSQTKWWDEQDGEDTIQVLRCEFCGIDGT